MSENSAGREQVSIDNSWLSTLPIHRCNKNIGEKTSVIHAKKTHLVQIAVQSGRAGSTDSAAMGMQV